MNFDSPARKKGDVYYYSEKELMDSFNSIHCLRDLEDSDFVPDSRPTVLFFESVWLGVAQRIREGKEVNTDFVRSKIKNWRNTIGEELYSDLFKARRSSSIDSINERVKNAKSYFLEG